MKRLKLVASGSRASENMPAGTYIVKCKDARVQIRGGKTQIVLTYEIMENAWDDGTVLKQWFNVKSGNGEVSPHTKYAIACELALGRPIKKGDEFDPFKVFVGKLFEARVGYRSNDPDGSFDQRNTESKKDARDFPRVHELLKAVSESS